VLTAVDVVNAIGSTLQLSILNPANGYIVREITGLDPVNATLTSSSLAQVDGAQPQNARRDIRNIVIKLGLEPDYAASSVADLRSGLYDYLMPKENVTLGFYIDDALTYEITGQIETFENAMFSADPEVDISIVCYDPDFYSVSETVVAVDTVDGTVETPIVYQGTSDAGLIFTVTLDANLPEGFSLYNTPPANAYQGMVIETPLLSGDIITVNTIPGQKSITRTRGAVETSLLYALQTGAVWLFFHRGTNYFRAYAEEEMACAITYTAKYGGI